MILAVLDTLDASKWDFTTIWWTNENSYTHLHCLNRALELWAGAERLMMTSVQASIQIRPHQRTANYGNPSAK